ETQNRVIAVSQIQDNGIRSKIIAEINSYAAEERNRNFVARISTKDEQKISCLLRLNKVFPTETLESLYTKAENQDGSAHIPFLLSIEDPDLRHFIVGNFEREFQFKDKSLCRPATDICLNAYGNLIELLVEHKSFGLPPSHVHQQLWDEVNFLKLLS